MCDWLDDKESTLRIGSSPLINVDATLEEIPQEQGTYAMVLASPTGGPVILGKAGWRGRMQVQPGYYVYIGSALGELRGRYEHHLASPLNFPSHWQVDYLRLLCYVKEVWYTTDAVKRECAFAHSVSRMRGAELAVKRFGASDCRCPAHLYYFSQPPSLRAFRSAVRRTDDSIAPVNSVTVKLRTREASRSIDELRAFAASLYPDSKDMRYVPGIGLVPQGENHL